MPVPHLLVGMVIHHNSSFMVAERARMLGDDPPVLADHDAVGSAAPCHMSFLIRRRIVEVSTDPRRRPCPSFPESPDIEIPAAGSPSRSARAPAFRGGPDQVANAFALNSSLPVHLAGLVACISRQFGRASAPTTRRGEPQE